MAKAQRTQQNEHNWTKIDDLVTKTMFRDRKSSYTFFGNRKKLVQNGPVSPRL